MPHQNATTLQVAGSIIAAVTWMIDHPNEGVCVPDDLPWREVLKVATPYLGTMHSAADRLGSADHPQRSVPDVRQRRRPSSIATIRGSSATSSSSDVR